jgi:hypothetical protein
MGSLFPSHRQRQLLKQHYGHRKWLIVGGDAMSYEYIEKFEILFASDLEALTRDLNALNERSSVNFFDFGEWRPAGPVNFANGLWVIPVAKYQYLASS